MGFAPKQTKRFCDRRTHPPNTTIGHIVSHRSANSIVPLYLVLFIFIAHHCFVLFTSIAPLASSVYFYCTSLFCSIHLDCTTASCSVYLYCTPLSRSVNLDCTSLSVGKIVTFLISVWAFFIGFSRLIKKAKMVTQLLLYLIISSE